MASDVIFRSAVSVDDTFLDQVANLTGNGRPDVLLAIHINTAERGELHILHPVATTVIPTVLGPLTVEGQRVAPGTGEIVALTLPNGAYSTCIPVGPGRYIYI